MSAGTRYCRARTGRGGSGSPCVRAATETVETDHGPFAFCRLHRGVLGTRGGITLDDGSCIANQGQRGYCWYPDARVGVAQTAEASVRSCRVCGRTEDDCSECVARTGEPCRWVGADLCSACAEVPR